MKYELMLITKTGSDGLISNVEKIIKEQSESLKVNKMGKKTLAYPILRQTDADYTIFNFEAEGTAVSSITGKLRLEQEQILRYLIIKPTGKETSKIGIETEEKRKPKVTVKTVGAKSTSKVTKKEKPKEIKKEKKSKSAKK